MNSLTEKDIVTFSEIIKQNIEDKNKLATIITEQFEKLSTETIITFKEFANKLDTILKFDKEFYTNLLITILMNPRRYTGIFRIINIETKLIQNITQSREIKFGDFILLFNLLTK